MLACLAAPLEAGLELAFPRRDDQHAHVRLRGARDHVRHVVLVPRRVEHGVPLLLRLEVRASNLDRLTFRPLLLVGVHDVRHVPRLAVLVLRLGLVLFDGSVVDHAGLE